MRTRTRARVAATNDLARAKADMDQFGYCLVAGALSDADVAAIRARLEEQAAAELADGVRVTNEPHADATNQWLTMLVNKGEVLLDQLFNPAALALVRHVVGEEFLLTAYEAHIVRKGGAPMAFHCDQWWLPMPTAPDANYPRAGSLTRQTIRTGAPTRAKGPIWPPVKLNCMFMITDFTEENGGTRLVPGSHLSGVQPDQEVPHTVPTVAAVGPAGTVVIWEGRTWHSAGENRSTEERYGLVSYYGAPQARSLANFTLGTKAHVLKDASPELKKLLGFKVWHSYGQTGAHGTEVALPADELIGEMRPKGGA